MIEKNGTWELVDRPTKKPVIGVKWVYKTKLNLDGSVQKNKARIVAKGTLIALATQKEWKLYQLDVKSAFLNGNRKELLDEFKEDMMLKYQMTDLGLLHHFLATKKLTKDDGSGATSEEQYRSIVGSLLYLTVTRLDIMHASSLLARFMHCPTSKHYGIAKQVLRYIKGTLDYGLQYVKGKNAMLIGFCDND
ncbi:unnamed protein product, partial [Prunus brigantina]